MTQVQGSVLSLRAIYELLRVSAPTVAEAMVGRVTREKCDARLEDLSRRLLGQARVDLRIVGREHLDECPDESFVVMSNHRGLYDVPVLFQSMAGRSLRMVTKQQLMRIPIWGDAMHAAGFISIDRKRGVKAIASLKQASRSLNPQVNIWFSPEGTRSRTGDMGPFKKGGFKFALDVQRRILPIALMGTEKVIHPNGFTISKGARIDVRIGAPIDTASYADDLSGLLKHTRAVIGSLLPA